MRKRHDKVATPIIRFRSMLAGVSIIAVLITGPLLMVWKQVYITSTSITIEKMTDSLNVLNKHIAELKLKGEWLSSNDRIEHIAKQSLGLDYPSSEQIVIIKVPKNEKLAQVNWPRELASFIKRSLFGENG
jgi:cell division protein FtsL